MPLLAAVEALRFYTAERAPLDCARTGPPLRRPWRTSGLTRARLDVSPGPPRRAGPGVEVVSVIQRPHLGSRLLGLETGRGR